MKELTFKLQGFWYKLLRLNYAQSEIQWNENDDLPTDICTLRRKLIFSSFIAILLFPLTILRLIFNYIQSKNKNIIKLDGLIGYVIAFALVILPILVGVIFIDYENTNFLLIWIVGLFTITLFTLLIA